MQKVKIVLKEQYTKKKKILFVYIKHTIYTTVEKFKVSKIFFPK